MMLTRMTPVLGNESALGVAIISRGERSFFIHNGGMKHFYALLTEHSKVAMA
ncbi:hypothetical protein [Niabella hibiscisoli]|uniref:hypothetical protein n=1 Tax=Niabella hibiscisoli TaxID=1825928 RepID=UPI001F0CEAE3|nr:hypothetical protein [Niabella hibiscisoli]MCH5719059.1 hypothetical protein [Niabella hibiscisoli]